MEAKGSSTKITETRSDQQKNVADSGANQASGMFGNLAFRPKPS